MTRAAIQTSGYYSFVRHEIMDLLPKKNARVLEIGCGAGATLRFLKEQGRANWTGGVEIIEDAATAASMVVDQVWLAEIEHFLPPVAPESMDVILCLDVLEHLIDPWQTVARLVTLLKPGGLLIASLPNLRNHKVIFPLLFRGKFRYDPAGGILDQTHLRFFVRETAIELLAQAGLSVDTVNVLGIKRGKLKWLINQLVFGALTDIYARQFVLRGRKPL